MKIVEYESKETSELRPNSRTMIFCTSAQAKEEHYLKRVTAWAYQMKKLGHCDLYCFHDGQLNEELLTKEHEPITFITFKEALGRQSVWEVPGWKRSLAAAMKLADFCNYKNCIHVESDALLCRIDKFSRLMKIENLVALPFCPHYGMPETAVMILNDRELRKQISDFYHDEKNLYSNVNFEGDEFYKLISPYCVYFGLSNRMEGKDQSFRYDVCTQIAPDLIRRSGEFQFCPERPEIFHRAIADLR